MSPQELNALRCPMCVFPRDQHENPTWKFTKVARRGPPGDPPRGFPTCISRIPPGNPPGASPVSRDFCDLIRCVDFVIVQDKQLNAYYHRAPGHEVGQPYMGVLGSWLLRSPRDTPPQVPPGNRGTGTPKYPPGNFPNTDPAVTQHSPNNHQSPKTRPTLKNTHPTNTEQSPKTHPTLTQHSRPIAASTLYRLSLVGSNANNSNNTS